MLQNPFNSIMGAQFQPCLLLNVPKIWTTIPKMLLIKVCFGCISLHSCTLVGMCLNVKHFFSSFSFPCFSIGHKLKIKVTTCTVFKLSANSKEFI